MENKETTTELTQEFKSFISVTDGALCNNIYQGYFQILSNKHPSRSIWVKVMITSLPTHDDTTGQEIRYFEEYTLGPNSKYNLACNVPGPTGQRFFWTPVEARWA